MAVILKTGKIGNIQIARGIDPILDFEAIRVVRKLPDFITGIQRGKKVNVWYGIPIKFEIK